MTKKSPAQSGKTAPKRAVKKTSTKKEKMDVFVSAKDGGGIKIGSSGKEVPIKILENPLDVYTSSNFLDLSQARFIERVKPAEITISQPFYAGLPGARLLQKLYLLQLLDFEQSEILLAIKDFWFNLRTIFIKSFQRVDFAPRLPLVSQNHPLEKNKSLVKLQEITLINLVLFLWQAIARAVGSVFSVVRYSWLLVRGNYLKQDEVLQWPVIKANTSAAPEVTGWDAIDAQAAPKNLPVKRVQLAQPEPVLIQPPAVLEDQDFVSQITFWPKRLTFKSVLAFASLALVIILPIKIFSYWQDVQQTRGRVLGEADQALSSLKLAQGELSRFNLQGAEDYFSEANQDFVSAQNQLQDIRSFLTILAESLPNNTLRSGTNLLSLGENLTNAGEHLLAGTTELTNNDNLSLTSRIKNFKIEADLALTKLKLAQNNLKKINLRHLPAENREQFTKLKEKLPLFIKSLENSKETIDFAINFLGDNSLKRYLVVFQNDNELRPTGGFMGSFALVDIKSGKIEKIELPKGGTYDVRAGLNQLLLAPQPLQLINNRWEFQDANWWPSWPTSAKKITWFFNKSGGPTIDGVIAINSDWLNNLLLVSGDIDLPKYGKTITPFNFEQEIQKSVELEEKDRRQPKAILGELAPRLIQSLFELEPKKLPELALALGEGLKSKDVLIYLFDEKQQKFIAANNWDGRIKDTGKDYLQVVATNIGGGKTDNVIKQEIFHQAKVLDDGSIIDQVTISRHHFGPVEEFFTSSANRDYLRVYVPLGSQLIKAAGFNPPSDKEFKAPDDYLVKDEDLKNEFFAFEELDSKTRIYNEGDKTVFANWVTVDPGKTKEIVLVYKLPFKLGENRKAASPSGWLAKIRAALAPEKNYDSYSLLVQKQPGTGNDQVVSDLVYNNKFEPLKVYPNGSETEREKITFRGDLSQDRFYWAGFTF